MMKTITCIVCPNGCTLSVEEKDGVIDVQGNMCKRGMDFAKQECTDPKRSVCTTVRTKFREFPVLPVKTDGEVPLDKIFDVMNEINNVVVEVPKRNGDVVIKNILNFGVDVVATSDMTLWLEGKNIEG